MTLVIHRLMNLVTLLESMFCETTPQFNSVATCVKAQFIRVNVLTGVMAVTRD